MLIYREHAWEKRWGAGCWHICKYFNEIFLCFKKFDIFGEIGGLQNPYGRSSNTPRPTGSCWLRGTIEKYTCKQREADFLTLIWIVLLNT